MGSSAPSGNARILSIFALATILGWIACGTTVIDARKKGDGGGGSGGSNGSRSGAGGGGGCTLSSTGVTTGAAMGTSTQVTACFDVPVTGCPNEINATMMIIPTQACAELESVDCGPIMQNGQCCYLVTEIEGGCP